MHKVVRPFPVSWDGLTLENLSVGDERDFGEMTAGLLAERYIEAIEPAVGGYLAPDSVPEPVEASATEVGEPTAEVETALATKRPYKKRN